MRNCRENLRFQCAFSKKGIRNNKIDCAAFIILAIIPFGYVCISLGAPWLCFAFVLFLVLILVFSWSYVNTLTTKSYLEITPDGILECNFKGRGTVSYPISEIISIEQISLAQAEKRYATFPTVLNSRGWELYPDEGVLITFNRTWLKSVFPVYFNPADIQGFMAAINGRRETVG